MSGLANNALANGGINSVLERENTHDNLIRESWPITMSQASPTAFTVAVIGGVPPSPKGRGIA